jgi:hypothetical protein
MIILVKKIFIIVKNGIIIIINEHATNVKIIILNYVFCYYYIFSSFLFGEKIFKLRSIFSFGFFFDIWKFLHHIYALK